ncbi:MAG: phosphonate ABC transporter ATP-binding protein [Deltaproteobacteria bacterium]|nr:phosphonate ABC transporter ATP-binding protein [Deltaproteobacteria bacterium]
MRSLSYARSVLSFGLALVACSNGSNRPEVGKDASVRDSNVPGPDAAPTQDADGPMDAPPSPDATSALDASPEPDATMPDATALDATSLDGAPADSGSADATVIDSGVTSVPVTLEVTVPADTPPGYPVHVAGDFQTWDPADPAYALTLVRPMVHAITLELEPSQTITFKFARGDWSRVEKGPAGEEVANRTLTVTGPGTSSFTVARWSDSPVSNGARTGMIFELTVPGFLGGRRVWIYLPPGYSSEDLSIRHPVLYMLDGQNLFDNATSFSGEWSVDETLEAGIRSGEAQPLIVVGIDNGGAARIDEYTPWADDASSEGGGGEAHLEAIITVLKPWVDAQLRTLPAAEHTGFGGSSLGGLMSVYTAYAHADVFGRIAALSPSVWWANERLVDFVTAGAKPPVRLWTDMGTAEGSLESFRRLVAALGADGFVEGNDLRALEVLGADHSEPAWAARFPQIVRFLFPGP